MKSIPARIETLEKRLGIIPTIVPSPDDKPTGEVIVIHPKSGEILKRWPTAGDACIWLPDNGRGPKEFYEQDRGEGDAVTCGA